MSSYSPILILPFRPLSPPMDTVQEKYINTSKLAHDFSIALRGCELADVMFIVGEDRIPLYGVKAILACRSRCVPLRLLLILVVLILAKFVINTFVYASLKSYQLAPHS